VVVADQYPDRGDRCHVPSIALRPLRGDGSARRKVAGFY
jgi:hypothetical protein